MVVEGSEISLNGVKYPLAKGTYVLPRRFSRFPEKQEIGDYRYANEQWLSNWIINDQRGGLGVEEMDLSKHLERYYWSTCDTKWKGHNTLNPLATAVTFPTLPTLTDGGLETWATASDLTSWTEIATGTGTVARSTVKRSGTYSALLTSGNGTAGISQVISADATLYRNVTIGIPMWAWAANNAATCDLTITDSVGSTVASPAGTGAYEEVICFRKIDAAATGNITVSVVNSGTTAGYIDDISLGTLGSFVGACDFNNHLYFAFGHALCKLNESTGASLTLVAIMPHTITKLVSSEGRCLYVFMGDDIDYVYMNTSEVFTTTFSGTYFTDSTINTSEALDDTETEIDCDADASTAIPIGSTILIEAEECYVTATGTTLTVTRGYNGSTAAAHLTGQDVYVHSCFGATHAVHWSNLLNKVNLQGDLKDATDPSDSTPTWTARGSLSTNGLPSSAVNSLITSYDSSGATIIYAATKYGLFAHDYTNTRWLETDVKFPNHPNGGKGCVSWNGGVYISAGLTVKRFDASTGKSLDVGLDLDDGLPAEFAGEIVKLIDGTNMIYELVDSSQTTGIGYSHICRLDNTGSKVIWDATEVDNWQVMTGFTASNWADEANAYDNSTATSASISIPAASWSDYIILTRASLNTGMVRYYASGATSDISQISIDVYYGSAWHNVYEGTFTQSVYEVKYFQPNAVTSVRAKLYNSHASAAKTGYIAEIQLNDVCDKTMYDGIVSSVYSYRLYFDHNDILYYIPKQRDNLSPKKTSGYTYCERGIHFTPWFDADTKAFTKLQKRLTEFCKDTTATEKITVKYRTDYTYTDLFSGWTTLATIAAAGNGVVTSTNFASSAGLENKAIQFSFWLERGSTNTLSPDLLAVTSSYRKNTPGVNAWTMFLDLTQDYGSLTPLGLVTALNTAFALNTHMVFSYRESDSHYVEIMPTGSGQEKTGYDYASRYQITLLEP